MALKEYIGLARLTQAFNLLKSKFDTKEDVPTVMSYADFMELTPQQQTSGYYLVVGGSPITNAYGISYQPNKTVGDALDDHADALGGYKLVSMTEAQHTELGDNADSNTFYFCS